MQTEFKKIKQVYDQFERFVMQNGILLGKETKDGYWAVAHLQDVFDFFKQIKLDKHKHLVDLGSGDGRVVLLASLFGIKATGLETDQWLLDCSLDLKRKINLPHFERVNFLQENFHRYDLSQHDILFIHPDKPFYRDELGKRLKQQLPDHAKLVVYGYEFHPSNLKHENEFIVNGQKFVVYGK